MVLERFDELVREMLRPETVDDACERAIAQHLVGNRMHQVGLAQARTAAQ